MYFRHDKALALRQKTGKWIDTLFPQEEEEERAPEPEIRITPEVKTPEPEIVFRDNAESKRRGREETSALFVVLMRTDMGVVSPFLAEKYDKFMNELDREWKKFREENEEVFAETAEV